VKLLVLGGTKFLGRAVVEAALARVPTWTGNAGLSAEREAALLSAWQRVAA
jgi:uncharacterized protein YbjT (DUF2867 family)